MSGPDERRGPDGGEHPLDVDARFADIVAHFHDGEPAAPRLVEDSRSGSTATDRAAGDLGDPDAARDGTDERDDVDPAGAGLVGAGREGVGRESPEGRRDDAGRVPPEDEDSLLAELEAAERAGREARAARVSAEVDRAVDGPDSHYVPADPPPLPRPSDLPGRLAWTAVLLGPLLLLLCALLWRSAPPWLVGTIATAMVAGFGYLVWRLPRTRDRDDPGDGAIV